jgi:hypothetical protein
MSEPVVIGLMPWRRASSSTGTRSPVGGHHAGVGSGALVLVRGPPPGSSHPFIPPSAEAG